MDRNKTRQMVMVGFLQAQNCTNLVSSWRHPESRTDTWSPEYYADLGRILEEGKFQVAFFDDRLAMPDRYGNDHKHTVENGIRCVKMDPVTVNGEQTHNAEDVFKIYGSEEAFYGLGQHQAGVWNYRGESIDLSQENTQIAVPLLLSSKGYGIFWNNDSVSKVNNRFIHYLYVSSKVADVIDYYFFYGPSFDQIIQDYRILTGAAPMYGKWAYGFWQC